MLIHTFALLFLWNPPRFSIDMSMTYVHVNHRISRDALRAMVIETRTFFHCNKRDIEGGRQGKERRKKGTATTAEGRYISF